MQIHIQPKKKVFSQKGKETYTVKQVHFMGNLILQVSVKATIPKIKLPRNCFPFLQN